MSGRGFSPSVWTSSDREGCFLNVLLCRLRVLGVCAQCTDDEGRRQCVKQEPFIQFPWVNMAETREVQPRSRRARCMKRCHRQQWSRDLLTAGLLH
jgi:hypothetical protein